LCETVVDCESAMSIEHDGKPYYFCCDQCLDSFLDRPVFFTDRLHRVDRVDRRDVATVSG